MIQSKLAIIIFVFLDPFHEILEGNNIIIVFFQLHDFKVLEVRGNQHLLNVTFKLVRISN